MNNQQPTKRVKSDGKTITLHSIFHTIQGEGPFSGVPAVFVRLAGCNLICPGCDTEYTKGATNQSIFDIETLIDHARGGSETKLVVITGGEPFRQNISELVNMLHLADYTVQIETNGSMAPQGEFIHNPIVICSPKTSKLNPKMFPLITAYKYVIDYNHVLEDGLPYTALGHVASDGVARPQVNFDGDIYVSPMDMTEDYSELQYGGSFPHVDRDNAVISHNKRNQDYCVESCMKHGYIIQIQLHKLLNME